MYKVEAGLKAGDRGKLIMACGTGKTFTALKIAEKLCPKNGMVLFLVPSISLLSQTLREWTAESEMPFLPLAVCSDTKVGKKTENEDISAHDLALPATTDGKKLAAQINAYGSKGHFTVIFSTYQSIQAINQAQKLGLPEFDLIICDEAHRTTGVTLEGENESHFVKVHDQGYIKGKKRLYMTATPRIYSDGTKAQAKDSDATLCSMDDEKLFGPEFHRLGFGEAVSQGLLSDYKVMVLAVDEKYVSKTFQKQLKDRNNELNLEDAVKIIGCWNGLSKRMAGDASGETFEDDTTPMRRAVAFSRSIKDSQRITSLFSQIIEEYHDQHKEEEGFLVCETDHVDGSYNALKRNEKLDWLKADTTKNGNVCRILSNARCLSEGVDVPALDAVMFLNPRNSIVDVVQSVGRVMRRAEGKKYGYVILPVGIPADTSPEEALKDNQKYKVVWQVLQALRAHDDRFNATVNQIDLNKTRPDQIQVIGVGGDGEDGEGATGEKPQKPKQFTLNFPHLEEWKDAIYAKIVIKCGDRRYWEDWAKDIAKIADHHIARIKALIVGADGAHRKAFDEFLEGLRSNLNPSIDREDAIEMLAQHLITKPVFDALFEGYAFTKKNPVSIAMQGMLDLLEEQAMDKEREILESFYDSVRKRASGIDNAAGKQTIIKELYEKFFKNAFPKLAEKMGIVYTPIEVVDFIIKSADVALRQEFGVGLSDKDVHVLDPFTGTGTFMVRLLQSGLIDRKDLRHKYRNELHANEILLLAYYIAAINIEETYHDLMGTDYEPFEGIVLTDTFQMTEGKGTLNEKMFPENNKRAARQNKNDIRVIIGNPPYSAQQESENDNNQKINYPSLDGRIRETYAAYSNAKLKKNLYDSYIRAIRWASDRIKDKGVICFVTNGSFIDANNMDGLRASLADEFSSVYCFNLRGNARTSGEQRRKEKGNVFGEGTRTAVAITILVKNPQAKASGQIFYHDIGDYLSREQKLKIVSDFSHIGNVEWKKLKPNDEHDWINQRDPAFESFISLGDKTNSAEVTIFDLHSSGILTSRDKWAYHSSRQQLAGNMGRMIDFYNSQMQQYAKACKGKSKDEKPSVDDFITTDHQKISWSGNLKTALESQKEYTFDEGNIVSGVYRPFFKQHLYYDRRLNERVYQMPQIFPDDKAKNLVICTTGLGAGKPFSALISDAIPNYHMHDTGLCFPLDAYGKEEDAGELFSTGESQTIRRIKENISDQAHKVFATRYQDKKIGKEDIFYYVYGILHSPEYRERFADNLKKMLPRIPFAHDFWAFSKAGRDLAHWHLNYETVEPYPLTEEADKLSLTPKEFYRVEKMHHPKRDKKEDLTRIVYNARVTLSGIPPEAYDYVVNGKPAIEWIMERYAVTVDSGEKGSGIRNDPNDWSGDPRYIIDLVKRIVRVSLETMKIVNSLPALKEDQKERAA